MTAVNLPYLPTSGNRPPVDSFLVTYSQTGASPCRLYVQEASRMMDQMINLTSMTLLQTQNLLGDTGLVDWQGRAAETFRNRLLQAMGMAHDQRQGIHQTGLLLEAGIIL